MNRGNPCESGLCTLCMSDCKGKCETWLSSLVGRKILYPREFGHITSGASHVSAIGAGYHALRIPTAPRACRRGCRTTPTIAYSPT